MKINLFQKLLKQLKNLTYTQFKQAEDILHKTFNTLTNTPLARLRHKEVWIDYTKDILEGRSIRSSAKHCKVASSITFRWRHRMIKIPIELKAKHLHGIVEFDETYFLESQKGNHHLERKAL
jgi:hypothetical protein